MPGFTTHYLFGQQTYQNLRSSDLKRTIQKYHTVFSLGLQGPDIFFYYIPFYFSGHQNPGSIAHTTDTQEFLKQLLQSPEMFLTKKEEKIAQAYVFGFIGHYLLDTTCHPYIYDMTHFNHRQKGYLGHHICLETDIDTSLLWFYQHRRPSEFHQNESIALSKEQLHVVSTILYSAFLKTYPQLMVSKKQIVQSIHSMQKETKLLYDPTGYKKTLIRRMESLFPGYPALSPLVPSDSLIFHKDPCNLKHRLWCNPWDISQKSTESFYDLFEKAEAVYSRMLNDIARFFRKERSREEKEKALQFLLNQLENKSYHSGLSL